MSIDMMRYILLLAALWCCSISGKAQTDSVQVKKFGLNKDIGITLGYSYVHSPLKGDDFVGMAPKNIISLDMWLWCVYMGLDGRRHKTGYDVYGFDETVGLILFKIGPMFKADAGKCKLTFAPYIGGAFVDVKDSSDNSIGARTNYGTHEKGFVAGVRLGLHVKHMAIGIHGSNREVGATIGFTFDPMLW